MKTTPRRLLLSAALACLTTLTCAALAEDASPAPEQKAPAAAPAPVPAATTETQSVSPVPSAPAAPSAATVPSAPEPAPSAPETTSSTSATPATPATAAPKEAEPEEKSDGKLRRLDAAPESPAAEKPAPSRGRRIHVSGANRGQNARVMMFQNAELGKDETADSVVAIFGNARSEGQVTDSVVSVFGNTNVTGPVADAVVSVLGNVYVDSKVTDVVSVLGNIELGPNAEVMGDVVDVGGTIKRDPKAIVHGDVPNVGIAPFNLHGLEGLQAYVSHCLVKLRPLAFGPHLLWAWGIAAGFIVFYALMALLFRGGIDKCVNTLETRPGGSILASLLTLLLTPVLIVLLVITVVGIAVVPFVAIALMLASLFGKATMLAWLGRRITKLFGDGPWSHPAFCVLIGGVIVLALYTIPVVGIVVYKTLGVLGLGVVVYTLLLGSKKEKRAPAAVAPTPGMAAAAVATMPPAAPLPSSGGPQVATEAGAAVVASPVGVPLPPPVALSTLPRAGFWIRTAALMIDLILVAVVLGLMSHLVPHWMRMEFPSAWLLGIAVYGAVLWKLKGTTIGGIICGLRVIRTDGRPLDWATAIVRALSCFVSLMIVGLGFIWVAIDDEKLSWHDKIAGTTVVLTRESASLV